jgi:phage terminase large subunit-like protein
VTDDIQPAALLAELEAELGRRMLELYRPYAKQRAFHAAGRDHRERCFFAGNQLGKTRAGGMEAAMHLTGRYPVWWQGRVFRHPIVMWAGSTTGEQTRDTVERTLLGRAGCRGTGTIPAASIVDWTASRGAADAVSTVRVRHDSGGTSLLILKTYDQGRARWQGDTVHAVWFDEEPPEDVYSEGLTRTNATGGIAWITATPLLGITDVVRRFFPEPSTPDRHLTMMTIEEAEHYSPAERARVIASYPEHEREARARGVPVLGSGRVFPIPEHMLREPPVQVPRWWRRIVGMDFGHGDHPTAAVWLAHDPETDVVHVLDTYRSRDPGIALHAAAIRVRGEWMPVAWPADGLQSDRVSGETVAGHYRAHGLAMLPRHATHSDGGVGVEAGIVDMIERMRTGRLKVAEHLADWWEEFRLYHRQDGKLVKLRDDLISATRYGLMMLRHAKTEPERDVWRRPAPRGQDGGGYDPHRW